MNPQNWRNRFERVLNKIPWKPGVSYDELITYLHSYRYEKDAYGSKEIFQNDYLLAHEIVEIECLKKKGLKIDKYVIQKNREEVYECHLKAMDYELKMACEDENSEHARMRIYDLISYICDEYRPAKLIPRVKSLIEKYTECGDSGIYSLLIKNGKDRDIEIGALGMIHFPRGYYVYIGSAQRGLRNRIKRHYSRNKKLKWHIDYLLSHAKLIDHFSLPLPKRCEERVSMEMQNIYPFIKNFGSSDSHAHSHLFHGAENIWPRTKAFFWKCFKNEYAKNLLG